MNNNYCDKYDRYWAFHACCMFSIIIVIIMIIEGSEIKWSNPKLKQIAQKLDKYCIIIYALPNCPKFQNYETLASSETHYNDISRLGGI